MASSSQCLLIIWACILSIIGVFLFAANVYFTVVSTNPKKWNDVKPNNDSCADTANHEADQCNAIWNALFTLVACYLSIATLGWHVEADKMETDNNNNNSVPLEVPGIGGNAAGVAPSSHTTGRISLACMSITYLTAILCGALQPYTPTIVTTHLSFVANVCSLATASILAVCVHDKAKAVRRQRNRMTCLS